MKITLLMATTVNGFIAGLDDDTNWVKDIDALNKAIAESGFVVMGRRTYDECMKYDAFPYKNAINIVMTHDKKLLKASTDQVIFFDQNPQEVIKLAKSKGCEKVLLIGGGHVNGSFMKAGLIDEIVIDIHPVIKSEGIHLFETKFTDQSLELIGSQEINDQIVQVRYRVKK